MAEVLGIADSVKGLTTIADAIVRKGFRYLKDVKDAEKALEKLVEEVNNLSGVLHSLNNVVERLEEDDPDVDPATQIHYIESCYKTLKKIQDHFDDAVPTAPLSNRDRLKWPLKREHTKELLLEIGRHKATMILAMTAREMATLLEILAGQDEIRKGIQEIKLSLEAERVEKQRIVISDERQKMLQFLGRDIDPRKWQDANIRLRQPGTGVWFTDGTEFRTWLSTDKSKLWINGIPGAGKTILMSSVIQEIEKCVESTHALAFFYCDYKDSETHSPSTILGSLAKQLVLQDERCYAELGKFYLDHTTSHGGVRVPTPEEVCELIRSISKHFQTTMIIVDGLDEITNDRADVAKLLQSLHTEGGNIKNLFASRPEVDIGYELEDFVQISIAAMSSDIRLYVASEIERRTRERRWRIRDPSLKDHIMTTLVNEADGMFRWVSCQMDYLCECNNDRDRREALKKLPPDLPSSYERILERVNRSSRANQSLVKKTLHWIVYAKAPWTTDQAIEALAICDGDRSFDSTSMTTEEDILHWCSSLVRKSPSSGRLELAHFTVEEFLEAIDPTEKPSFQQYRLSGDQTILANACLTFILCKEFDGFLLPERGDDFNQWVGKSYEITNNHPFSEYACLNWMYHVHRSDWEKVKTEVMNVFSTTNAFEFWTLCWLLAQHDNGRDDVDFDDWGEKFYKPISTPTALHWAAVFALDKVCALLIEDGISVSQSSAMGTPLYCAMVSKLAIDKFELRSNVSDVTWQKASRKATIQRLLDAGVDANEIADARSKSSALSVALQYGKHADGTFIAPMLLEAGARISTEDFFVLGQEVNLRRGNLRPPHPPPSLASVPVRKDSGRPQPMAVNEEVCGISPASLFHSVTRKSWKRLVRGTECNMFWFALTLIACRWPPETFQAFFSAKFSDLFTDPTGAEFDRILAEDTPDWQGKLIDILSRAIRFSAPTTMQATTILQGCLLSAVYNCNVEVMSHLLLVNSDLDPSHQRDGSEKTPLHFALDLGCSVEPLISHGADVLRPNKSGKTPLEQAAEISELDVFQLLWETAMKPKSVNTLHGITRGLLKAAARANDRVLRFLVAQLLARKMMAIDSLLELALGLENVNLLELLLDLEDEIYVHPPSTSEKDENEDCSSDNSVTTEGLEARDEKEEEDEELEEYSERDVGQGTESQSRDSRSSIPTTDRRREATAFELEALYLATNPDASITTFSYLFRRVLGGKVHLYQSGNAILHILASSSDESSLKKLEWALDMTLNFDILNRAGFTPLAVSIQTQNIPAMEILLEEGADADFPFRDGQTALHLACELGNWFAVKALLNHGCKTGLENDEGLTAADVALEKGHLDFAALVTNSRVLPPSSTSLRPRRSRMVVMRRGREGHPMYVAASRRGSSCSSRSSVPSVDD